MPFIVQLELGARGRWDECPRSGHNIHSDLEPPRIRPSFLCYHWKERDGVPIISGQISIGEHFLKWEGLASFYILGNIRFWDKRRSKVLPDLSFESGQCVYIILPRDLHYVGGQREEKCGV
jgi:hypothetical protein